MWQSVEGMKVVCHELAQASNDPDESAIDELVKDADGLVSCLANKVAVKTLPYTSIFHEELLVFLLTTTCIYFRLVGCQDI